MASYKVPQDVEADDKLLGPFSFRQFLYLIGVAIGLVGMWALWMVFPPLAIIPLPFVVFFGALALPLKKDQPMEVYLAAIVSFYLKPRKRLWVPDGRDALIQITAPKTTDVVRTKSLSQEEAAQRLGYLANLSDTRGWAVRGVNGPVQPNTSMNADAYYEAQQTEDLLDNDSSVSRNLDSMISQADARHRQDMVNRMRSMPPAPNEPQTATPQATAAQQPVPQPQTISAPSQSAANQPEPHLSYNPYPSSMNQSVIQPLSEGNSAQTPQPAQPQQQPPAETATTSEMPPSPDIINLANNPDLSIETIAREANRIHQKEAKLDEEEEVVISLR